MYNHESHTESPPFKMNALLPQDVQGSTNAEILTVSRRTATPTKHCDIRHVCSPRRQSNTCSRQQLFGGLWNGPQSERMWPQESGFLPHPISAPPSLPSSAQLSDSTAPTSTTHCSARTWKRQGKHVGTNQKKNSLKLFFWHSTDFVPPSCFRTAGSVRDVDAASFKPDQQWFMGSLKESEQKPNDRFQYVDVSGLLETSRNEQSVWRTRWRWNLLEWTHLHFNGLTLVIKADRP